MAKLGHHLAMKNANRAGGNGASRSRVVARVMMNVSGGSLGRTKSKIARAKYCEAGSQTPR
jgi:hypothetical protein